MFILFLQSSLVKGLEARPRASKERTTSGWSPDEPRRRTARGRTSGFLFCPGSPNAGAGGKEAPRKGGRGNPRFPHPGAAWLAPSLFIGTE